MYRYEPIELVKNCQIRFSLHLSNYQNLWLVVCPLYNTTYLISNIKGQIQPKKANLLDKMNKVKSQVKWISRRLSSSNCILLFSTIKKIQPITLKLWNTFFFFFCTVCSYNSYSELICYFDIGISFFEMRLTLFILRHIRNKSR